MEAVDLDAVPRSAQRPPARLRVGLFADTRRQPRWVAEAFARVARAECAEIVALGVAGEAESAARWRFSYRLLEQWAFRAEDIEQPVDLVEALPGARVLAPPFADLLALDLDVAFALGAVDESPLDGIARLGVWRFRADGVAEVARGLPLTGSALLVRLAPGEESRIAYQSWSRTHPLSVARNRAALLHKTTDFPLRALREAQRSGREWLEQRPRLRERRAQPRENRGLSLISMGGRILRRGVEKALAVEQWSLAFALGRRPLNGGLAGFTRIEPPADRDWADPFALERNGRYYVFFEERIRGGKGHIAMLELDARGRWSQPVRVLERDYHLSHPFVLEHDGQLWLVPESAAHGTVEAYRCVDFPHRWRLERVLIDGVRLVDATFHKGADRWWMLANGRAGEGGSFNDELHLFHSRGFVDGWQPHPRNPVRSDARGTRPAGALYWRNGALYRPAQICAPRHGAGIALHRVLRLTPELYAERLVETIVPPAGAPLIGLRTVNRAGELIVTDALARRRRI